MSRVFSIAISLFPIGDGYAWRNARSDWIRRPCRRQALACQIESTSLSESLRPLSNLSPAPLRIPPGRPQMRVRLILWFSKNNSNRRTSGKKTIATRNWCDFASKMQFAKLCFLWLPEAHFCKMAANKIENIYLQAKIKICIALCAPQNFDSRLWLVQY